MIIQRPQENDKSTNSYLQNTTHTNKDGATRTQTVYTSNINECQSQVEWISTFMKSIFDSLKSWVKALYDNTQTWPTTEKCENATFITKKISTMIHSNMKIICFKKLVPKMSSLAASADI